MLAFLFCVTQDKAMSIFRLGLIILFYAGQTFAEPSVVVNELLFDLNKEAQTEYDFKTYKEVSDSIGNLFPQSFSKLFKNEAEQFVFTRLAYKEAEQLDIQADQNKVDHFIQNYKFNGSVKKNEMIKNEIKSLFRVSAMVAIKERQLQSRQSLSSWLQVLKRKYSLGWKSNDFKSRIDLGI